MSDTITATTAPSRRQRLATFNARHSHELFSVAKSFVDTFSPAFPPIRRMIRLGDKATRFDFACVVSVLCKHADDLTAIAPMIESIGDQLQDYGFTPAHVPAAKAALMCALSDCCGADWTPEMERDWSTVCDEFCACMNLRAAGHAMRPVQLSMAA